MQLRMLATMRRTSIVTTFPLLDPQPPPPSSFPSTFSWFTPFSPSGLSRGLFICHQPSVPSAAITCKNCFLPYFPPAISHQPTAILTASVTWDHHFWTNLLSVLIRALAIHGKLFFAISSLILSLILSWPNFSSARAALKK